jgi:hypothetical protein
VEYIALNQIDDDRYQYIMYMQSILALKQVNDDDRYQYMICMQSILALNQVRR